MAPLHSGIGSAPPGQDFRGFWPDPAWGGERLVQCDTSGQVSEPPQELAYDEWVREMVREHLSLSRDPDDVMGHSEAVRNAYANETMGSTSVAGPACAGTRCRRRRQPGPTQDCPPAQPGHGCGMRPM